MSMVNKLLKINYVVAILFCGIFPFLMRWIYSQPLFDSASLLFSVCCILIGVLTNVVLMKMLHYNSNKSTAQLRKQLIPSYFLLIFIIVFISLLIFIPILYVIYLINDWDTANFVKNLFQKELPGVFLSLLIGVFLLTIIFFFTVWRQAIEREQQSQEEALKYKYKNLKAQVNPHFLFNSLNTLSEIVYVDAKKADSYIQKLAGIYRYILDHEDTDLILLNEELEFVEKYFELQKERDGNRIHLEISVDNAYKSKIVPISLQILVENALKHNAASEENPLRISICERGEYILVSNPIRKRSTLIGSHGSGLSNLKERILLVIGKEMIVTTENDQFIVKLPIVRI